MMHCEYREGTLLFLVSAFATCVSYKQTMEMVKQQEKKPRTKCQTVESRPPVGEKEQCCLGLKRPAVLLGGRGQGSGMEILFIFR